MAKTPSNNLSYDPGRIIIFETLFKALKNQEFENREEQNTTTKAYRNFAFHESYCSNYIEGTVFNVDDAKQIIATQQPLTARNQDSHDVSRTYQLASNKQETGILRYFRDNL